MPYLLDADWAIEALAGRRNADQILATFDIVLAATALHHNLTVLTRNTRHFSRIPNLKLYQSK
jgi:predicted nucleic acid-binding protein